MTQPMEAQQEVAVEQPHSVEISINAKAQYSGKVKVYSDSIAGAYHDATLYAEQMEKLIKEKNEGGKKE